MTYASLGLEDVLCLPTKKKVSHKDIIFGKQSILKHAYFTNTYNYRTQMTEQLYPVGDGWPLLKISLTFSRTYTARRRVNWKQENS